MHTFIGWLWVVSIIVVLYFSLPSVLVNTKSQRQCSAPESVLTQKNTRKVNGRLYVLYVLINPVHVYYITVQQTEAKHEYVYFAPNSHT